jgi:hypothetical protein
MNLLKCLVDRMGLFAIHVLHFRALCDVCRAVTSDVFCGGDMGQAGRYQAIEALRASGWAHRAGARDVRDPRWVEREGAGEWVCEGCRAALLQRGRSG